MQEEVRTMVLLENAGGGSYWVHRFRLIMILVGEQSEYCEWSHQKTVAANGITSDKIDVSTAVRNYYIMKILGDCMHVTLFGVRIKQSFVNCFFFKPVLP